MEVRAGEDCFSHLRRSGNRKERPEVDITFRDCPYLSIFYNLPKQVLKWEPNLQTHEFVVGVLHSNYSRNLRNNSYRGQRDGWMGKMPASKPGTVWGKEKNQLPCVVMA